MYNKVEIKYVRKLNKDQERKMIILCSFILYERVKLFENSLYYSMNFKSNSKYS